MSRNDGSAITIGSTRGQPRHVERGPNHETTNEKDRMMGQPDKVVVITGASRGIGEATALMLAERGAKVVLGATGPDRLKAVADRIVEAGGEATHAKTDVRRRGDVTNLINLACERYGQLDVLVNNAGIGPISPLDDLRVSEWEDMIDINIKGVLYGIAAVLPLLPQAGFRAFRQHRLHVRT